MIQCLNCARKHIASADAYIAQSQFGYPNDKWNAIGDLWHAERHVMLEYPTLANSINKVRKDIENDILVDLDDLMNEACSLAIENQELLESIDNVIISDNRNEQGSHILYGYDPILQKDLESRGYMLRFGLGHKKRPTVDIKMFSKTVYNGWISLDKIKAAVEAYETGSAGFDTFEKCLVPVEAEAIKADAQRFVDFIIKKHDWTANYTDGGVLICSTTMEQYGGACTIKALSGVFIEEYDAYCGQLAHEAVRAAGVKEEL